MNQIAHYMNEYVRQNDLDHLEGLSPTPVPGVKFYRNGSSSSRQPLVYQSGIIVMGQGEKNIYLGDHKMSYGPGDFVVFGVPLPLECEAMAEDGKPILGLTINLSQEQLHSVINGMRDDELKREADPVPYQLGMNCMCMPDPLNDAYIRLLKVMLCEDEARFLGPDIVKEIIYRVLKGPLGHILYERANMDGNYARVSGILDKLHKNYAYPLTVEKLAEEVHMSVPAFHRAFKQVTAESPLQYLKKIRLSKAKELIQHQGYRASDAAREVGYNSVSQFSREFKRHFSFTPTSVTTRA